MKIIVWGLGYVGTVSAACLAQLGHEVIGVEPHKAKVDAINSGRSPIREPDLDKLVSEGVASGRLKATQDGGSAVPSADVSLICVGTPSAADGGQNLTYLRNVALEIGNGLKQAKTYHVVVVRSTLFPGTTRNTLVPLLEERSELRAGTDFGIASNPEFMVLALPVFGAILLFVRCGSVDLSLPSSPHCFSRRPRGMRLSRRASDR